MVKKSTSFKKRAKGQKGNFKKKGKQVAAQVKKPKSGPKPETKCYYCNWTGHWKWNYPKYLEDKKGRQSKQRYIGYTCYCCVLTSVYSSPLVFDTSSVAKDQ